MSRLRLEAEPEHELIDPARSAVLVIDMQNDFGSKGGMFDRAGIPIGGIQAVVPNIATTLRAARGAKIKVIYIKMGFSPDLSDMGPPDAPNRQRHQPLNVGARAHDGDGHDWRILVRGGWGTEVIDALKPEAGDVEIWKTRYSAFFETELDRVLRSAQIKHLIITGCTTSVCVDSTVRDAFFRDYHCVMLRDCMAEPLGSDQERTNHEATLQTLQTLFAWTSTSRQFFLACAD